MPKVTIAPATSAPVRIATSPFLRFLRLLDSVIPMPGHEMSGPPASTRFDTSPAQRPVRWLAMLCIASALAAPAVLAQGNVAESDSLARLLMTPSIHKRADVVARLNALPIVELSPSARMGLVALLDAEATGRAPVDPNPPGGEDETYSEYLIELTDAVLKLKDPASLRGLTRLGIQTGFQVQRFIASFGATSLPSLDEAWRTEVRARPSIITTWAFTLARTGPNALNPQNRRRVSASIIAATDSFPIAVASAARVGSLSALVPLLADVASRSKSDIVRGEAQKAVNVLAPLRAATTPVALLEQTSELLRGFCAKGGHDEGDDDKGEHDDPHVAAATSTPSVRKHDEHEGEQLSREEACGTLRGKLTFARATLVTGRPAAAKLVLEDIVHTAARARASGAFTSAEAALIEGNATYILSRL
jgi:hypothetical protein